MTQWTRTISRQITNTLPTWRTNMATQDRWYEIGENASTLEAQIIYPGGVFPTNWGYNAQFASACHYGWGSSVWASDMGPYGTIVFSGTGEDVFDCHMTQFNLSENSPTWSVFQQPPFSTADDGSDLYWDRDLSLAASHTITSGGGAGLSGWDGTFPVKFNDWVFVRKLKEQMKGGAPWIFRYELPHYIPAADTGTGSGAIVVSQMGTLHGPFSNSYGQKPAGATDAQWFDEVWSSGTGARKRYVFSVNVNTKVWTRHTNLLWPDLVYGGGGVQVPASFYDESLKRLYYFASYVSGTAIFALFYIDLSAGLASGSIVGPLSLTDTTGGGVTYTSSTNSWFIETTSGQKLFFWRNLTAGTSTYGMIDVNSRVMYSLVDMPGLSGTIGRAVIFSSDPANNRLILVAKANNNSKYWYATIPASPEVAANWSWTEKTITQEMTSTEVDSDDYYQHGDRSRYIPELGTILFTQRYGKALVFRPSFT